MLTDELPCRKNRTAINKLKRHTKTNKQKKNIPQADIGSYK